MFAKILRVPLIYIVLVVLLILIGILSYSYYQSEDSKNVNLIGGLVAGFIVAIIQMILDWDSYASSEKLKELQIKDALVTRSDKIYYGRFIDNAQSAIDVMGVSGERFMKDFADTDSSSPPNSRIIIDLLKKGIIVRILMPKPNYLEASNIDKSLEAKPLFEALKQLFPESFFVKYFEHIPAHSIFRVDNECIVGPVFTKLPSRFTPAIRFYNTSPVVKQYLAYFEEEWANALESYD